MKIYKCRYCEKDCSHRYGNKANIYCSTMCQQNWQFENITLKRFFEGKINNRPTIRRCLEKIRGYKCEVPDCLITHWLGKSITLQVDHINGNAGDNMPENVRLICPNCHSQTESYAGGNKGNGRAFRGLPLY